MNSARRDAERRAFLASQSLRDAAIEALVPDASFRRYFRLRSGARRLMLMDAPPPAERVAPFVAIAQHLQSLGLRAPAIYAADLATGFVLLEDFGDDTYTRLLARGADERSLYALAVDTLVHLHRQPRAVEIDLPRYAEGPLIAETMLFADWYYPAMCGTCPTSHARTAYVAAWQTILSALPATTDTLVLRDYHIDNLMRIRGSGVQACGLLDFQDALRGPATYDLVSLLEDARRDLAPDLVRAMRERYSTAVDSDQTAFDQWYAVLGVQRHCKVAGIFVRLCARDGKDRYLRHLPRVMGLLSSHLAEPALAPLAAWLAEYFPTAFQPLPQFDPDTVRQLAPPPAS